MGRQLEQKLWNFVYMTTAARLLDVHKRKGLTQFTIEEWLEKIRELVEMANSTSLIREKIISTFITDWKPHVDFLHETEKNALKSCGLDNRKS